MEFERTLALVGTSLARLQVVDHCDSTNSDLVDLATGADAAAWPDASVYVTLDQRSGRGRLGRVWVAPPGQTIAVSILLRPRAADGHPLSLEHYGWLPLLAGTAMAAAVSSVLPGDARAELKWPNDVLIEGRKVSGLLGELVGSAVPEGALVMGAGVNLTIAAAELPTPTSTSLALEGADVDGLADRILAAYLEKFLPLYRSFVAHPESPVGAELVTEACSTLGQRVRVELPNGVNLVGLAIAIDESGRLLVRDDATREILAIAAGDVTHLRLLNGATPAGHISGV